MNLRLRMTITRTFRSTFLVRVHLLRPKVFVLGKLLDLARARRFETLKKAADNLHQRMDSLMPELQTLNQLTEDRKRQVLAASSSLLQENDNLREIVLNSVSTPAPGTAVLVYMLRRSKIRVERLQRRHASFSRIASSIGSQTFYGDLLLWLAGGSEEMLGCLNEEYQLRISSDGEGNARDWYYDQAIASVRVFLWTKIERLAAVGALIDLISRWFKK